MKRFDLPCIEEIKNKLDVDLVGAASLEALTPQRLKDTAAALLPEAKSVIVFGKEIYKEVVDLLEESKEVGEAKGGDLFGPHSDYLNGRLTRAVYDMAGILRREGYQSLPLPAAGTPTDQRNLTSVFSYKHAAQAAGLGTIGRHSLLLTEQFGPRLRLACLLTEAPVETSPSAQKDYCINCEACIRACPARALHLPAQGESYSMNKFACRTYRQAGLTCSVCMKACDQVLSSSQRRLAGASIGATEAFA